MILDRNIDVHKKIKWTVNGKYLRFFFVISLKDK